MERAKVSSDDTSQPEAAVGFPAYKADLGANSVGQGLSTSVHGRNDLKDESYSGDGILKTVDVEQTGLPVP